MSEVKTNKITSLASNNDITLDPDGTGDTIIASGKVGIGTATPSSYNSGADDLVLATTGATGITIASGTSNNGSLFFADGTSGADQYRGYIQYEQTNNAMAFGTNGAERMRIDSAGKVRIGTSSGVYTEQFLVQSDTSSVNPMTVNNTRSSAATDYAIIFGRNGSIVGSIQTSLSATSYVTSSDYRLKTNVSYDWDATSRLKQLKPARFNFIADADTTVDGFLAHEAQAVVPESVTGTKDEVDDDGNPVYQGIDQAKLVPLLVKTIQELEARITALEAE
jgi:hypothetical protein